MSLFSLTSEVKMLYDLAFQTMDDDGVLDAEIMRQLTCKREEFEHKATNVAVVQRKIHYTIDELDAEIDRLKAIKEKAVKSQARIENALSNAMQTLGIEKIESIDARISFRKSEKVVVDNPLSLPEEYKRVKVTVEADKTKLKEALKSGATIEGVTLEETKNIQIK